MGKYYFEAFRGGVSKKLTVGVNGKLRVKR